MIQVVSTGGDSAINNGDYASGRTIAPPSAPSTSNCASAAPIVVDAPREACESKALRFALALSFGFPLTPKGFGNWWRWPYRICVFVFFFLYWQEFYIEFFIRLYSAVGPKNRNMSQKPDFQTTKVSF